MKISISIERKQPAKRAADIPDPASVKIRNKATAIKKRAKAHIASGLTRALKALGDVE